MNSRSPSTAKKIKKFWVILPAAGLGTRMAAIQPKQYQLILNYPVLMHTLSQFLSHPEIAGVMVVVAKNDNHWNEILKSYEYAGQSISATQLLFCEGGKERVDSVLAGLEALKEKVKEHDWVLIHDAARPGIKQTVLENLLQSLTAENSADGYLLAVQSTDTLKQVGINGIVESTIERQTIWRAQTPQAFRYLQLKNTLQQQLIETDIASSITDESIAMEHSGYKIKVIAGCSNNFKITTQEDISRMEIELRKQFKLGERVNPEKFFQRHTLSKETGF